LQRPSETAVANRSSDGKLRLLILTPDFPPAHGGVQTLLYRLAVALRGFDVEVVTLQASGGRRFDGESSLATRRVGAHAGWGRARMLDLNAGGLRHALRFRPNVILNAHLITSPAAAAARRLLGARVAQYFYANEIIGKPRLAAFAVRRADVVIAISHHTAALLSSTGASPEDLAVIPPGVDIPHDASPLPVARPTVLTIAQLKHSYKGHDVLARALGAARVRVPELEWVVIGEGPLRAPLERIAQMTGVAGAVRFLGAVPDCQRDLWLRRAHLLALPSRLPGEGFGIVYLEANAYGKPVVAGDVAGAREAVIDGETGLLVDPSDAAEVEKAVTRLLLDDGLRLRLGRVGAARAREFAWPLIAKRVETALLASGGSDR
jgi:phosphatidyl-myo-inositol dimannoside synthase